MTCSGSHGGDVVLLSGGIDSATALALARGQDYPPTALFVDYGQAAASSEAVASASLAAHYRVPHTTLGLDGLRFGSGEILGRNAMLVHVALLATSRSGEGTVTIAIHAGTSYRDCSPDFVDLMQRSYDFHTGGKVVLAAPFIDRHKAEVLALAIDMKVPLSLTYSCEAGNQPCGECLSCRDREVLLAGPK